MGCDEEVCSNAVHGNHRTTGAMLLSTTYPTYLDESPGGRQPFGPETIAINSFSGWTDNQ